MSRKTVADYVSDLTDTFGEDFTARMTHEDYDRIHGVLGWTESVYIRVLRHYSLDIGDLDTRRVRRTQLERLAEAFGADELLRLNYRDYPRVKERLGWAESTFKTALNYMGRNAGNLRNQRRIYMPTDAELEQLMENVSRSMVHTLIVTGCRFGELWRMDLRRNELTIYTQKGGDKVHFNLAGMEHADSEMVRTWVEYDSKRLGYDAARKRWQKCVERGFVSPECQPHNLRHRAATIMQESGYSLEETAEALGHRSTSTTRHYRHGKNGARAASLLLPKKKVDKFVEAITNA